MEYLIQYADCDIVFINDHIVVFFNTCWRDNAGDSDILPSSTLVCDELAERLHWKPPPEAIERALQLAASDDFRIGFFFIFRGNLLTNSSQLDLALASSSSLPCRVNMELSSVKMFLQVRVVDIHGIPMRSGAR